MGILDWKLALDTTGGDEELLRSVVEAFLQEYQPLMRQLHEAPETGDAMLLRRSAHTLKGSLRIFGDTPAGRMALQLEAFGREERLADAQPLLPEFTDHVQQVADELRGYLQNPR